MSSQCLPAPSGRRPTRAFTALLILSAAALAGIDAAACGGDDDATVNFIGVTDAQPPRLGAPDGGRPR